MKLIILILLVVFVIYIFLHFFNTKDLYEIMVFETDENKNPTGKYCNLKFKKNLFPLPHRLKNIVYYSERYFDTENLDKYEDVELSFSFYINDIIPNTFFRKQTIDDIGFMNFENYAKEWDDTPTLAFEEENFTKKVFHLLFLAEKHLFMNYGKKEININSFFNINSIGYCYDSNNRYTPLLSYISDNSQAKNNTVAINFNHFISDYEMVKVYKYKSKNNKIEVAISEVQNYLYSLFKEYNKRF